MTSHLATTAIGWIWATIAIIWLIGYATAKSNARTVPLASRVFNLALAFFGYAMLGTHWFARGWLSLRFAPDSAGLRMAGVAITLAGALFAIWARLTIGNNWSGRPSVKAGHTLVVNGPYALARHPIYTGLLTAVAGTGLCVGQWHAILGFFLILAALAAKIGQEERFMLQTFPDSYPGYRRRVKALIPGVV